MNCFILTFQPFILPPATLCDGTPDLVTRIATGKPKMILVALKRSTVSCGTAQFVPVTRSSCCLFPHHLATAPAAGLLWMPSRTGSSLTSNPCSGNHPVLHAFLFAQQLKLTLFIDHDTFLRDLPGQELEILERAEHLTNTYRCVRSEMCFLYQPL